VEKVTVYQAMDNFGNLRATFFFEKDKEELFSDWEREMRLRGMEVSVASSLRKNMASEEL